MVWSRLRTVAMVGAYRVLPRCLVGGRANQRGRHGSNHRRGRARGALSCGSTGRIQGQVGDTGRAHSVRQSKSNSETSNQVTPGTSGLRNGDYSRSGQGTIVASRRPAGRGRERILSTRGGLLGVKTPNYSVESLASPLSSSACLGSCTVIACPGPAPGRPIRAGRRSFGGALVGLCGAIRRQPKEKRGASSNPANSTLSSTQHDGTLSAGKGKLVTRCKAATEHGRHEEPGRFVI